MKKLTFLAFALLFIYSYTQAQNVTGNVTDAFTHKAITGVTVTPNGGTAITTDSSGKFEIPCTGKATTLTVSIRGYENLLVNVPNCNKSLKVELVPSSVQLNEVQVSDWSNNNSSNQLNQPQSIGLLTRTDLNRGTGLALQDAIDLIPGVNMESRSAFGGQHIVIRGYYGGGSGANSLPSFNTNGLGYQVSINNVPITDALGTTIMDDIDFSTLGKVEVIKGPQSTLYGSGIGGAVNLYTLRPTPNTTELSQQAMGGSYGLWRTNTMLTTAGSNYDLVVDYGHQNYDGFRPHDASRKDYLTFTGNYYGNKQTLTSYFSYSHSYEELAGEQNAEQLYSHTDSIVVPTYITNNSHALIESYRGGVTDDFKFSKHFSNQTTLFASGHTEDMPFAKGFTDYTDLNFGARTGFVYDQQFKSVGVHGILGGSFIRSSQTMIGESFNRPSNLLNQAWSASGFTEWKITLPLQFIIKAGVSVNAYKYSTRNYLDTASHVFFGSNTFSKTFSPAVTPSIAIEKVFNEHASVYANVSLGYTPPSISAMLVAAPSGTFIDTALKPERGIQYEIGTKGSFLHKKLSYQVALFYLDVYNKLITEQAAGGYSFTSNVGEQRNFGVELALSYAIIEDQSKPVSLLRPFVSYTYSHFTYHNFSDYAEVTASRHDSVVNFSGKSVAGIAPNRFNAGLDFALKYGVYLNVTYQYTDKTPYTFDNLNYAKAYNLLSAKIGYHNLFFKHLGVDVYAGVDNMLSSTYYSGMFVGETLYQLTDGAFLPAPHKPTFYGGGTISYRF